MRIIAGTVGGRLVKAPRGAATRPTTDRVREAIFNILGSAITGENVRVLDLYAGSGALGLEALSRGAAALVFVDEAEDACRVISDNLSALGLGSRARVVREKVVRYLRGRGATEAPFHIVFVDPPYEAQKTGEIDKALGLLDDHGLVAQGGMVVAEHDWRLPPVEAGRLELFDRRRYGQTAVSFYRPIPSRPSKTEGETE
jgi:16S rRNA (guanine966-N2)-methyltransferase